MNRPCVPLTLLLLLLVQLAQAQIKGRATARMAGSFVYPSVAKRTSIWVPFEGPVSAAFSLQRKQ
jgi:hypothetical protein